MSILSLNDRNVTHRQEIVQLLSLAQTHQWDFAQLSIVKNHVTSQPLKLLTIDPEAATFGIDCDIVNPGKAESEPVLFRIFTGGLSIVFRSRLTGEIVTLDDEKKVKAHLVQLPYEMRCTQLRRTHRINLDHLPEVPVVLYGSDGTRIRGSVVDVSLSGAKFRLPQDVSGDFTLFSTIETCKIRLPNKAVMRTTANVMGVGYDADSGDSMMRCQFPRLKKKDEIELENLIESCLETTATPELAIAV